MRQPSQVGQRRPIKQAQAQSTCSLQQQLQGQVMGQLEGTSPLSNGGAALESTPNSHVWHAN